jgi:hypothetical protein
MPASDRAPPSLPSPNSDPRFPQAFITASGALYYESASGYARNIAYAAKV